MKDCQLLAETLHYSRKGGKCSPEEMEVCDFDSASDRILMAVVVTHVWRARLSDPSKL